MQSDQAKWVMDFQFVRGINHFQAMEYLSSNAEFRQYFHPPNWAGSPQWPYFGQLAEYGNRLSYLLSMGRPTAQVALYYPTTSGWMGDFEAERSALEIARRLLEQQRDFDFVDEEGLTGLTEVRGYALENRSEQRYRAVIVPEVSVLSRAALNQLRAFANGGGRVVFAGKRPEIAPDRSFLQAGEARIEFATATMDQLPASDVVIKPAHPEIKYLHRRLAEAELYFLFNEGAAEVDVQVAMQGEGGVEEWDPLTGAARAVNRSAVHFDGYGTKVLVVSKRVGRGEVNVPGVKPRVVQEIAGDWEIEIGGRQVRGALKSWADYGQPGFWGAARYRIDFDVERVAPNEVLELGEVAYSARVKLNGQDLGQRAWRPFRWDVGKALRRGRNVLEVEVVNTRANDLAGDAGRIREVEQKGWLKNSYINMYGKFDREMVRSGLFGPVRLMTRN